MEKNPSEINEAFYCPITGDVMKEPVIFPDGYTYEKSAIEDWIKVHHSSPYTRQRMEADQGIPNRALKDQIDAVSN